MILHSKSAIYRLLRPLQRLELAIHHLLRQEPGVQDYEQHRDAASCRLARCPREHLQKSPLQHAAESNPKLQGASLWALFV